jgi:type VI secretion system protein ImpF
MAGLSVRERLQPSLLDRLTDDEPRQGVESRERRVISVERLRQSVLRDLSWLFNTGRLSQTEDLDPYPEVACSVLNYGLRDLSGVVASSLRLEDLERSIRQAVWDFEPRILRETVVIRATVEEGRMNVNSLVFVIEGTLWAQPIPLRMFMKTEVDLETGQVLVREQADA